jgi:hypothetical protein
MALDRSPRAGWRVELTSQVDGLEALLSWVESQAGTGDDAPLVAAVQSHLRAARQLLDQRGHGSRALLVLAHLDAARTDLLRLAPAGYLFGVLPDLVMRARHALTADDLRLVALETIAQRTDSRDLTTDDRQVVIACALAVDEEGRRDRLRLDNFRSIILSATALLSVLSLAVAAWGWYSPEIFPICFVREADDTVVCPSAELRLSTLDTDLDAASAATLGTTDVAFLLFLGVVGAALSTALVTRNLRGSVTPAGLSISLSLLKLATGSLTALFGIIVIRAGLVPGIESLDTRSEIIAWALVFGFSQQLFTGVIDRRTQSVLEQTTPPSIPAR